MSTPVAGSLSVTPLYTAPGDILVSWDDTNATWRSLPQSTFTLPLAVAGGGTGQTSLALNRPLIGNGTNPVLSSTIVTDNGTTLSVSTNLQIGTPTPGIAAQQLIVNGAASAPQAGLTGQIIAVGETGGTTVAGDSYGAAAPVLLGRRARGTAAAPSAVQTGDNLLSLVAVGYGASAYGSAAGRIDVQASENWSNTANGTRIWIATTTPLTAVGVVRLQIYQGVVIGNVAPDPGQGALTLNGNVGLSAAALVVPASLLRLIGPDSNNPVINIDCFGGAANTPGINLRKSSGTGAAPSAVQNTNPLGTLSYRGFGATAWGTNAVRLTALATENWTDTAQGANLSIYCNANGSTANPLVATFQMGLQIGAPAGGDLGAGTLNMSGNFQVNQNAVVPTGFVAGQLQVVPADGVNNHVNLYAFSGGTGVTPGNINFLKRRGTGAASTATQSGDTLGNIYFYGYDGTTARSSALITAGAAENTGATWGGSMGFWTVAVGGTAITQRAVIQAGLVIGAPTGGDKGVATLNATGVYAAGVLLTSDAALKTDIAPLPECLELVAAIEPKRFKFKDPGPTENPDPDMAPTPSGPPGWFDRPRWGFIAQDVERVMTPHDFGGIEKGADGIRSLSHSDLLAVLWQAVREMSAELAELRAR